MIKISLIRKTYNFMLYKFYECKVKISTGLITDLRKDCNQNTMLILDRNISKLTEDLLNNKDADYLQSRLNLLKEVERIERIIDELETSTKKREEIINSESTKEQIEAIEEAVKIISIVIEVIKTRERKPLPVEESLQRLINLLNRYIYIARSEIESIKTARQIGEIQLNPLDRSEIDEVEDTLIIEDLMFLSESALNDLWLKPGEDEAWKDLLNT